MAKVWLVTGAGSGLGRAIATAALEAGHIVAAGARRPEKLAALGDAHGDRLLPLRLDVRDEAAALAAVRATVETHGRLDVLVNNAGDQVNAPFEQISSEQFRDVVETNLFGTINTTRAAVPIMRAQRSGHIFQVSSIGGRVTIPGNSPYHAAKWAVGGFSDSLADEVASFGVRVCTLEPGGIRTDFKRRAGETVPALLPDYEPSVGPVFRRMFAEGEAAENDPERIAALILRLADTDDLPKRLILGRAAMAHVEQVEARRTAEMVAYGASTLSTTVSDS